MTFAIIGWKLKLETCSSCHVTIHTSGMNAHTFECKILRSSRSHDTVQSDNSDPNKPKHHRVPHIQGPRRKPSHIIQTANTSPRRILDTNVTQCLKRWLESIYPEILDRESPCQAGRLVHQPHWGPHNISCVDVFANVPLLRLSIFFCKSCGRKDGRVELVF